MKVKKRKLLVLLLIGALCLSGCSNKSNKDINISEAVNENISTSDTANNAKNYEEIRDTEETVIAMEEGVFAEMKVTREQNRERWKEVLMELINSANITDEEKQQVNDEIVQLTDIAEKELAAESLLASKGFEEVFVIINDGTVDVIVSNIELNDSQREQIKEIVSLKTEIVTTDIIVVLTNLNGSKNDMYESGTNLISEARISREQTRSLNKEMLVELFNSENVSNERKQAVIDEMVQMVDIAEKELAAETLLVAQGYEGVVVSICDHIADVIISSVKISDSERVQIEDIINRKTGIEPANITITPVKPSDE